MKKVRHAIVIALIICLTIVPIEASAVVEKPVTDEIEPQFITINTIYALLQIDESNGIATCVGEVQARDMVPVEVVVQLQQLKNGMWDTLYTWSNTGTLYATKAGSYAIARGYTYRTKTIAFVYDNDDNIIESGSATHQVDYPKK